MKLGPSAARALLVLHKVSTHEDVKKLKQSGVNKGGGNYKFFSQIDLAKVSTLVQQLECVLIFEATAKEVKAEYRRVKGKGQNEYDRLMTYTSCDAKLRLQCVDNRDDFIEIEMFGFKVDQSSDKALGAATVAKRYAFMALFDIPTIEGDPDGPDDVRIQDRALTNGVFNGGTTYKPTIATMGKSL